MKAVQGKKIIFMYRPMSKAAAQLGKRLALTTENSVSISMDADSTPTKDGAIRTPGTPEIEITTESVLSKDDTMIDELRMAMLAGERISIWKANLDEPTEGGKYKGTYYEGYLTSMEETSASDDFATESLTFGVDGVGADGEVTVPADIVEEALYVFKDTTKEAA